MVRMARSRMPSAMAKPASKRRRIALALAALTVVAGAERAAAQNYPRLGLYGSIIGNGYPLWDSTGTLDPQALDQVSRYDEVILDVGPLTPYRPDAFAAIRQRHPGISM